MDVDISGLHCFEFSHDLSYLENFFCSYIPENQEPGRFIAEFEANDRDSGINAEFE